MYTKNKRKFQNKPPQRNAPRSVAPAPKFKDKKEKFLKETLPCIVLLIFMAFWSIGSALSIIDRIKQRQTNTSMITASADTPSYNGGVVTFTLDGFRGMYCDDGSGLLVCVDTFTVNIDTNNDTFTLLTSMDSLTVSSSTENLFLDTNFTDIFGETDYECYVEIACSELSSLSSTDYVSQIDYHMPAYSTSDGVLHYYCQAVIWFNNQFYFHVNIRNVDGFPVRLSSSYTDFFSQVNNQQIVSLQARIAQLQAELVQARDELSSNMAIVGDLQNSILFLENEIQRLQELANKNYQFGYNDGKAIGINEGIASANDYSFLSLIGAVVDVPVKTFTSLFDWNLLGINLKQFFLSILSVMAILAAVKLIMR